MPFGILAWTSGARGGGTSSYSSTRGLRVIFHVVICLGEGFVNSILLLNDAAVPPRPNQHTPKLCLIYLYCPNGVCCSWNQQSVPAARDQEYSPKPVQVNDKNLSLLGRIFLSGEMNCE